MSFISSAFAHKMMTDGGMEYARDVLEKAFEILLPQGFQIKYPEHFSPGRSASL